MTLALRAEWTKLRTLPSTGWALLALLAGTLLFTALVCATSTTTGGPPPPGVSGAQNDVVRDSLLGVVVGQVAAVTLGVLAIGSEYATGMIRTTFVAEPRRRLVLVAKAFAVGTLVLAVGLAAAVLSYAAGRTLLSGNGFTDANGYPAAELADLLRPVAGTALYLAALALLSLAIGAILRSTAGALTVVLSLLFVPLIAASLLPESAGDAVLRAGPMTAGLAVQRTVDRPDNVPIGEWAGLGVVWLWAAGALALALWLIQRRDVTA